MKLPGLEPMLTEVEAADALGVKARSLRTERAAGRLSYRLVAGKVMYLLSDLVAWQQATCRHRAATQDHRTDHVSSNGVPAWQDRAGDRGSSVYASAAGPGPSTTSAGPSMAAPASVARARQTSATLKRRLPAGSPPAVMPRRAEPWVRTPVGSTSQATQAEPESPIC